MDSTKGPIIKAGTEVEALETRTLDSGVLRVRIAEDQWVSERTGKGDLILELVAGSGSAILMPREAAILAELNDREPKYVELGGRIGQQRAKRNDAILH